MDTEPGSKSRLIPTLLGGMSGAFCAFSTWACLFLIATIDDTSHGWKGLLISFGLLLPIVCIPCGVFASRSRANGMHFLIANLGITILLTTIAMGLVFALSALPVWAYAIITVPTFFACGFIVERFASGMINSTVQWLANEPPIA